MKRLLWTCLLLAALCAPAMADTVTLTIDNPLSVMVSKKLEWEIIRLSFDEKVLIIRYRWIDSVGKAILMDTGGSWQKITFQNIADNPETLDINESVTGWTDIMGSKPDAKAASVEAQLQTIIWGKLKPAVGIAPNNTATLKSNQ